MEHFTWSDLTPKMVQEGWIYKIGFIGYYYNVHRHHFIVADIRTMILKNHLDSYRDTLDIRYVVQDTDDIWEELSCLCLISDFLMKHEEKGEYTECLKNSQ